MRTAARTDANQAEIVQALRKCGATVYEIKEPVDLLCGFRGRAFAIEIKNPDRDWRLTDQQRDFFRDFTGEAYLVETVDQAIRALNGPEALDMDAMNRKRGAVKNKEKK